MTARESAKIVKSLGKLDTHEREKIEDKGPVGPFYSGFVSYETEPIKESIEIITEYRSQWEQAKGIQDPITQSDSYQEKAQYSISWANEFLDEVTKP